VTCVNQVNLQKQEVLAKNVPQVNSHPYLVLQLVILAYAVKKQMQLVVVAYFVSLVNFLL